MNFFQKMLDPKERAVELHHVAGIGTMIAHWFLAIWQTVHGMAVDLTSFGTGSAAIITSVAAAGWGAGKQRQIDPACQEKPDA
jgi:hypothetical protein